jgi:hypothetical protein
MRRLIALIFGDDGLHFTITVRTHQAESKRFRYYCGASTLGANKVKDITASSR